MQRLASVLLLVPLLAVLGCGRVADPAPARPTAAGEPAPSATPSAPANPTPASPAGGGLTLTPQNTKIEWVGTKPGGKHVGGFGEFTGAVELDAADDAVSKIKVDIETESLFSDTKKLTNHLKTPDFFEVKKYPKAVFGSTAVKAGGSGEATHTITGDLTLHGVTKPISFPAKIELTKEALNLNSNFTISRKEFGMTYQRGGIDDAVAIEVSVLLPRK